MPPCALIAHHAEFDEFVPQPGVVCREAQGPVRAILQPLGFEDEGVQPKELRPVQAEPGAAGQDHLGLAAGECGDEGREGDRFAGNGHGDRQVEPVVGDRAVGVGGGHDDEGRLIGIPVFGDLADDRDVRPLGILEGREKLVDKDDGGYAGEPLLRRARQWGSTRARVSACPAHCGGPGQGVDRGDERPFGTDVAQHPVGGERGGERRGERGVAGIAVMEAPREVDAVAGTELGPHRQSRRVVCRQGDAGVVRYDRDAPGELVVVAGEEAIAVARRDDDLFAAPEEVGHVVVGRSGEPADCHLGGPAIEDDAREAVDRSADPRDAAHVHRRAVHAERGKQAQVSGGIVDLQVEGQVGRCGEVDREVVRRAGEHDAVPLRRLQRVP